MRCLNLVATALLLFLAIPALGTEPAESVTVDIFVSNGYDDSAESLENLSRLLDLGFLEIARPGPGQSLDRYIFDRYDFGPSQLPRTFALIADRIRAANANRKSGDPFYIPAIPRRRSTKLNPNNPYYDVARLAEFDVTPTADGKLVVDQRGQTIEHFNRGSKYTLLRFFMPARAWETVPERAKERADKLIRSVGQNAVADQPVAYVVPESRSVPTVPHEPVWTATTATTTTSPHETAAAAAKQAPRTWGDLSAAVPMTATAFTASPASASPTKTSRRNAPTAAADTAAVAELRRPASTTDTSAPYTLRNWPPPLTGLKRWRTTYLFIIDDGWPGAPEAESSVAFIEEQINRIRGRFQLSAISIPPPTKVTATEHSSQVATAIGELTTGDKGNLVRVVYIPVLLLAETVPMHRELLHLEEILSRLPSNPWRKVSKMPPGRDADALADADDTLGRWQKRTNDLIAEKDADWALRSETLNAIYDLGEFVADSSNSVFVVNQSWSVRGGLYKLSPTDLSLTVAAAGKVGVDVEKEKLDFARHAADEDKFLAVMFTDDQGVPICGSAMFAESAIAKARVVAFDGTLPDRKCGTSFAAPRVAWGVAARMSTTAAPPSAEWQCELQQAVRNLRRQGKPYSNIMLDDLSRLWR